MLLTTIDDNKVKKKKIILRQLKIVLGTVSGQW